jgi:hypothetical protein
MELVGWLVSYVVVSKLDKEESSFMQNSAAFKSIYLSSK